MQLSKNPIPRVSIVIPILDIPERFDTLIQSLESQIFKDFEVIFVGTNGYSVSEEILCSFSNILDIKYFTSDKIYPGEKRNIGITKVPSGTQLIAFLDVGTIPENFWLKEAIEIHEKGFNVIFGKTKYIADNLNQELIRSAVYGKKGHITLPGTLILKNDFPKIGYFVEGIRAGEDVDWKERALLHSNCSLSQRINLHYVNLPNAIIPVIKKFFIYYLHTSQIYSLKHTRDLYLSLLLIFLTLGVPQWNSIFGGLVFIPHITKIYIISFLAFSGFYLIARRFIWKSTKNKKILANTLSLVSFCLISISIFLWNSKIATLIEFVSLSFAFITELFLIALVTLSFLYRGIYRPLLFEVEPGMIFPFRWVRIGFIGILIDLAKFLGMVFGSLLGSTPFKFFANLLRKIFKFF
jgi:glycosyltransferase involved in cell wall biosynthesis